MSVPLSESNRSAIHAVILLSDGVSLLSLSRAVFSPVEEVWDHLQELTRMGFIKERHGLWHAHFPPSNRFSVSVTPKAVQLSAILEDSNPLSIVADSSPNQDCHSLTFRFYDTACDYARAIASSLQLPLILA